MKHTNQNNFEILMHEMYRGMDDDKMRQVKLSVCSAWDTKNEILMDIPIFDNMGGMFGGMV